MSEWSQEEVREFMKTGKEPKRERLRRSMQHGTWAVPEKLTIEIPVPPKATHPNARSKDWRARAGGNKKQREDAQTAATSTCLCGCWLAPNWERAEVQATFYLPRSQDSSNLAGWLKATWDGLQDAQIIVNDSGLTVLPPAQITAKEAKGERKVVLVITSRAAV